MNILFVHQNFPGQFLHLAPALRARGHTVLGLTADTNTRPSPVAVVRYRWEPRTFDQSHLRLATTIAEQMHRGETVAQAADALRTRDGFTPDVIFGHIGWGETLFLKQVWPKARLLVYAEFFYRPHGLDTNFDPEFSNDTLTSRLWITSRQAHLLMALEAADAAIAPTEWQARSFPSALRNRISVIHDGIDTRAVCPSNEATVTLPGHGVTFKAGDEVLTFVNRNLEPYRGYHIFMRALPDILRARPNAHAVIVGGEEMSYSPRAPGGRTWKEIFLDEIKDRLDLNRVHFTGRVPYDTFLDLMRVSRAHAYLTYPFVLSWSMLEAMSAGALVVASRTPPVEEIITDGVNGRLVDFFDLAAWTRTLIEVLAEPARFASLRSAARDSIVARYDLHARTLPRLIAFVEGTGTSGA